VDCREWVLVHDCISCVMELRGLEVQNYDALVDDYEMLLGLMAYVWWRLS
jgi:hypothetical protein